MGTLFGTLNNSLDAIEAFQTALNVSQNNVSNASTPGYALQVATLDALPFDPSEGVTGGVRAGPSQSTQDEYVNQAVNSQVSQQGNFTAQSSALAAIQGLFDVSGQSGVVGNLNQLFQSFSAWAATPGSASAQQGVLTAAQELSQGFQSTAASLYQTTIQLNQQISSTVQQINQIASQIQAENVAILQNPDPAGGVNAGLDAQLHASIQSLSQLGDVSVTYAPDGTATVLLGGQTPLVIGAQQNSIQTNFSNTTAATYPGGVPNVQILDANGQDITGQISQGTLGGLLNVRNGVLPGLQGSTQQVGSLNQLAQQVADRVNAILTAANTPTGAAGSPLFAYNHSTPTDVASTLTVDPNITASTLAPADPGPPPVSNGAALTLSNLAQSTAVSDEIAGRPILQFLSSITTQVGQKASDAQTGQNLASQSLAQAQAVQTQISGVSLDAEAINVMELQKGYQAAGQMVNVIDSLASTLLNMIPVTA